MKPKVSIIISVFNQERYLKEALTSILNQSYKDFELLVLDDGSTDKSALVLSSFKDKRIRFFKNKKSRGLTKNLNFLLDQARGKYIARMDGDDISLPVRLEKQVEFLEKNKDYVLLGTWAEIINSEGKRVAKVKKPVKTRLIKEKIIQDNPFIHPSVMFRKKEVLNLGGYNEEFIYAQDYELFLRVVAKYKSANLPLILLKLRWLPDFDKQKKQHHLALKARWLAISKYGYNKMEAGKILKPLLFYLFPVFLKKAYWQLRFK